MRTSTLFLALATARSGFAVGLGARNECNANNCLRGVRGTDVNLKPSLASRLADCSSFMEVTVTPAPVTTTITSTVTITEPPPVTYKRGLDARQVTVSPTAVPTYATYCPNASAYSSACSCVGITAYTTTAPTPVATAYATATTTVYASNPYECDNPQVCDTNSVCGGGCGLCHPDTNTGKGYCVNRGSCPPENDCNKDEDCKAGGVCLNTCCGKTCDYAADNFCSANSPKMLFRKGTNDQNLPAASDDWNAPS